MRLVPPLFAAVMTLSGAGSSTAALRLTVDAGAHRRVDTPVSAVIAKPSGETHLVECRGSDRVPVPSQWQAGEPTRLNWILNGVTEPGKTRIFELVPGAAAAASPAPGVTVADIDGDLLVSCGDGKVLQYNCTPFPAPVGTDTAKYPNVYGRTGFVHPLWSPAGDVLTCIYPPDHIHHMGLWHPWTKTKFEGRSVDFWNLRARTGTVRYRELLARADGPVFGGFRVRQEAVDLKAPGGEKVALEDFLAITVWSPQKGGDPIPVDYVITQKCASDSPFHLPPYRYGGFGFRARLDWDKTNSDYLTSEGKTRKDGHGTRARWCIVSGATEHGKAGILFLSHPDNRAHPEPMRIWPDGKVFFNFCPVQKTEWDLEPGKEYCLRYRMCLFQGEMPPQRAEELWQDFAAPPIAKAAADQH